MSGLGREGLRDLGKSSVCSVGGEAPPASGRPEGQRSEGGGRAVVWVVASSLLFALALLLTAQIRGEAGWLGSGGCLAAAVTAGTVLWRGAMRRGRDDDLGEAVAFGLLATAAWVWGWGEVIWMGYTLFLHEVPPFPSMADVGFLVTPVLATCALGVWIATTTGWRVAAGVVLDGLVVAPALLLLLASTAWASVV